MKKIVRIISGFLIILCIVFNFRALYAQAVLDWYGVYKGAVNKGYDPEQIAVDKDGNLFVTGTAVTVPFEQKTNYLDIVTAKFSPSGTLLWAKSYLNSGPYSDNPVSLVLDKTGNVYVTGVIQDTAGSGLENFITLKYNGSGDLLWTRKVFNTNSYSYRKGLLLDSLSGPIIFCFDYTNNYLIKYNSNGDSLWRFSSPDKIDVSFLDRDNNLLISGNNKIKKISGDGNLIWSKSVPHSIYESNLAEDKNGNYILCGQYSDTLYLYFLSHSGDLIWSKIFKKYQISTGYYFDNTQRCLITKDGNLVLGFETLRNPGGSEIALMKFNSDGNLIWDRKYHYSDTSEQFLTELKEDARGFIYASAYSLKSGLPYYLDSNFFAILKYDPNGNLIRVTRKESLPTFVGIPKCFTLGGNDNFYLAIRNEPLTGYDYTILAKYSQPFDTLFVPVPTDYELAQNFPNPFNMTTNFSFRLPEYTHVRLSVYDALGRKVAVLIDDYMQANKYIYTWEATGLSSGLYIYRFETPKFSSTGKMVLVK